MVLELRRVRDSNKTETGQLRVIDGISPAGRKSVRLSGFADGRYKRREGES